MNWEFRQHLQNRGWKPYLHSWVDWYNEVVTFPLWFGTKLVGYQRYIWREEKQRDNKGRYWTYVSPEYKQCVCYGTENLLGYGPLFIVEGIWDALRVKECYYDCLAVLCNDPHKQLRQWIKMFAGNRPIISICDNDGKAGNSLRSMGDHSFIVENPYKDINEYSFEQAMEFLEKIVKCVYM